MTGQVKTLHLVTKGLNTYLYTTMAEGISLVRMTGRNAHGVESLGGKYVKAPVTYDQWHQSEADAGRPYVFTTASPLLDDFWREVKRAMKEKGILNDL